MASGVGNGGRYWARVLPIAALGAALSISGCDNSPFGTFAVNPGEGDAGNDAGRDDAGPGDGDSGMKPDGCPEISFVSPLGNRVLDESDDVDGDNCENGFQYDVIVATSAPEGTTGTLYAGATQVATATVSGAVLAFDAAQLTSSGRSELAVQVGTQKCTAKRSVSVSCSVPSCAITKPVVSATHPRLNGVPAANGGDRVSADGAPYQVLVEVSTSVETGQPVELFVDEAAVGLTSLAEDGKAIFAGVTLTPDGAHSLEAVCRGRSGLAGRSAKAIYTVDTTPPTLTVTEPGANARFEEAETFRVCGATPSQDATELPESVGSSAQNNFCAGVGSATPVCGAVTASSACVDLPCPGGPAFDVRVSLRDLAGNMQTAVVPGVSCRVDKLGAEIVAPRSSVPGDTSTNLLSAGAQQDLRDADADKLGAQTAVVACTDGFPATLRLMVGKVGAQLNQVGSPVAAELADVADGCPAGKPYIARFTDVTLPESDEDASGDLVAATRLVVEVNDDTSSGSSAPVNLWVDSVLPQLAGLFPSNLCEYKIQGAGASYSLSSVQLVSSVLPITLKIMHPDNPVPEERTQDVHGSGINVNFGQLTLKPGATRFAATVVEPSGNSASLPSMCAITFGDPPVVTWVRPKLGDRLNAATDSDSATPGWQGDIEVQTDLGGTSATVVFATSAGTELGAPVAIQANGRATLTGVTLTDGASVQLVATTSEVVGRGIGQAFVTVPVDTMAPMAVADLSVTVPEHLRRQTGFQLSWRAPDDGGKAVRTYNIRVSSSPITDEDSFNAATRVIYTGSPAQPGGLDGALVTDQRIERDYYFAVIASDVGGNNSSMVATGPHRASFRRTSLTGVGGSTEQYGRALDGSSDLNGDGFTDLIVGASNGSQVYIYFGSPEGYPEEASARIVGIPGVQFGLATEVVGDIDGDGRADLAISAPGLSGGSVLIFRGRSAWPSRLDATDADFLISADVSQDGNFSNALFGGALARLGDFDGDGANDFAIGARGYGGDRGYVAVIRGVTAANGPFPSVLSLAASSERVIATMGPSSYAARFGWALTGLGKFYSGGGTTLMASAYTHREVLGTATNRYGAVYAFAGELDEQAPTAIWNGTRINSWTGFSIAALGALNSPMAVAYTSPAPGGTGGTVSIHMGTALTGPFGGAPIVLSNALASRSGNGFGSCVFSSAISGVQSSYSDSKNSFLGSALPDVLVSGLGEGTDPARLYIIDGQKIPSLQSGQIAAVADVIVPLPETWTNNSGCMPQSRAIRDLNNDGYADIAVSQYVTSGSYAGNVLVLW